MPGTLFVVATPIGNLEDLSGRALRALREVVVIAAEDTRRTARLLAHYGIPTPTTSLHAHNEEQKSALLVARLLRGEDVALVSDAGTPGVSDPGRRLVRAAHRAGATVSPIPGPSAVLAALSASGFSADRFTFLGFPPVRSKDRKKWLDVLIHTTGTVVLFEAPHRIRLTLDLLLKELGDIDICLGRELTKIHETLSFDRISAVLDRLGEPRGEYTLVFEIGHTTKTRQVALPNDAQIAAEFGHITEYNRSTRRQAIAELSSRYGISANEVYKAIERGRRSGK